MQYPSYERGKSLGVSLLRQLSMENYVWKHAKFCYFKSFYTVFKQQLSYRKQIARQLCTQYIEGISRSNYPWPWNLGQGSLKVSRNGTIGQIIHDLLLVKLLDIEYYRDLEMWVRGH